MVGASANYILFTLGPHQLLADITKGLKLWENQFILGKNKQTINNKKNLSILSSKRSFHFKKKNESHYVKFTMSK